MSVAIVFIVHAKNLFFNTKIGKTSPFILVVKSASTLLQFIHRVAFLRMEKLLQCKVRAKALIRFKVVLYFWLTLSQ